jgi:metal-responsive CopG/Arc/MetJ family transcriptional regulator
MSKEKFSINIPGDLVKALDAEARKRFRNRTQLITDILAERYQTLAPATAPASSRPNNQATQRVSRK